MQNKKEKALDARRERVLVMLLLLQKCLQVRYQLTIYSNHPNNLKNFRSLKKTGHSCRAQTPLMRKRVEDCQWQASSVKELNQE